MDSFIYKYIYVEQSTPLSLMYQLLINTSVFCTYRWYVTCTLALIGCAPASSLHLKDDEVLRYSNHLTSFSLFFFFSPPCLSLSLSLFLFPSLSSHALRFFLHSLKFFSYKGVRFHKIKNGDYARHCHGGTRSNGGDSRQ